MVGLLSVGSEAKPRKELIGEAGTKELVEVKKDGEDGLAKFFEGKKGLAGLETFGVDGLPPLPSGASLKAGADKYVLTAENAYPEE